MKRLERVLQAISESRFLPYFFLVLVLADTGYSFLQNYYMMSPDGDMAGIIWPSPSYSKVLKDPFGLGVVLRNEVYAATNRFFTHWVMSNYFKTAPFLFQHFTSPIKSIFLSMAIARTFFQVTLIALIAAFISKSYNSGFKYFITAALIITPFFQMSGYERFMGIADRSITYSFSYAFSLAFVLFYFFQFYKSDKTVFSVYKNAFLVVIALIIAFGGPIGAPIILIVCPSFLLGYFYLNFIKQEAAFSFKTIKTALGEIPSALFFHFSLITLLCVYSFYVGRNNEENLWTPLSLSERYALLPKGFAIIVLKNLGIPLLMSACFFNLIFFSRIKSPDAKTIFSLIKYLGLFSLIYLLLLPLGGYRAYRPNIIRYDTFSPVTICLIYTYSVTSIYLIRYYKGISKYFFVAITAVIIFHYTWVDKLDWEGNKCDKEALYHLASSPDKIVYLDSWCNVMSWNKITDCNGTEINCQLLKYWGVIKDDKLYYQKEN